MTESLADLRHTLPDAASPRQAPVDNRSLPDIRPNGADDESFFSGLIARYGGSRSREQRQLAAVAIAVGEAVTQQGFSPQSPSACFAALLSALRAQGAALVQENDEDSSNIMSAQLTLLANCAKVAKPAFLAARETEAVGLLSSIIRSGCVQASGILPDPGPPMQEEYPEDLASPGCIRGACSALSRVVSSAVLCKARADANDITIRASIVTPMKCLLMAALGHSSPKVRKAGVSSLADLLQAFSSSSKTAYASLSNTIAEIVCNSLPSATISAQQQRDGEEDVSATKTAFHSLGALLQWGQRLDGISRSKIAQPLAQTLADCPKTQPLLAHAILGALHSLLLAPVDSYSSSIAVHILSNGLLAMHQNSETLPRARDSLSTITQLVAAAIRQISDSEGAIAVQLLPKCMHLLSVILSEGKPSGAPEAMSDCIRCSATAAAAHHNALIQNGTRKPSPLSRVMTSLQNLLSTGSESIWSISIPAVQTFVETVGPLHPSLVYPLLERLYALVCDEFSGAEAAMAACMESVGLTLVLKEGLPIDLCCEDYKESRVVLLKIISERTATGSLETFSSVILPQIKSAKSKLASSHSSQISSLGRQRLRGNIELAWETLKSLCIAPADVKETFPKVARPIGECIQNENDTLRARACTALTTLCRFCMAKRQDDDKSSHEKVEKTVSKFSPNFFPILFNILLSASSGRRGVIAECIGALANITESNVVEGFFKKVLMRILENAKELAEEKDPEKLTELTHKQSAMLDLANSLASALNWNQQILLWRAMNNSLLDSNPEIQKRAYSVASSILKRLYDAHQDVSSIQGEQLKDLENIEAFIISAHKESLSASRKQRLGCLKYILMRRISLKPNESMGEELGQLVTEVVIATKESNAKTRACAYDTLVSIAKDLKDEEEGGEAMNEDTDTEMISGRLQRFLALVCAGIVSREPHVSSAAIMGAARLLFEFPTDFSSAAPKLLPSISLILQHSNSRELAKAALGLFKVAASRSSVESLQPILPSLMEALVRFSDDSKNRFRQRVRAVIERLLRKVGYQSLYDATPEEHRKLVKAVRKAKQRAKRGQSIQSKATGMSMDEEEDASSDDGAGKSVMTKGSWHHSRLFGSERTGISKISQQNKKRLQLDGFGDKGEVMDLLDAAGDLSEHTTTKRSTKQAFPLTEDGRLDLSQLIDAEAETRLRKRKREDFVDRSDDSGSEDVSLRAVEEWQSAAGISTKSKRTNKSKMSSKSAKSAISYSSLLSSKSKKSSKSARQPSKKTKLGSEFAPKRRHTGGDMLGKNRLEPFAYWPLDAKMLNKRKSKSLDAAVGLKSVVKAKSNQQAMTKRSLDNTAKPVRTKIPRAQRKAKQKNQGAG